MRWKWGELDLDDIEQLFIVHNSPFVINSHRLLCMTCRWAEPVAVPLTGANIPSNLCLCVAFSFPSFFFNDIMASEHAMRANDTGRKESQVHFEALAIRVDSIFNSITDYSLRPVPRECMCLQQNFLSFSTELSFVAGAHTPFPLNITLFFFFILFCISHKDYLYPPPLWQRLCALTSLVAMGEGIELIVKLDGLSLSLSLSGRIEENKCIVEFKLHWFR